MDVGFVAQVLFMHHPRSLYVGRNSHFFQSEPRALFLQCHLRLQLLHHLQRLQVFLLGWRAKLMIFPSSTPHLI